MSASDAMASLPPSKLRELYDADRGVAQLEQKTECFYLKAGEAPNERYTEICSDDRQKPERYILIAEPMISPITDPAREGFLILVTYWEIIGWKKREMPLIVDSKVEPGKMPDVLTTPSPDAPKPPE